MTGIILAGDDLEVGLIVTVHHWNDVVLDVDLRNPPKDDADFYRWSFQIAHENEPRTAFKGTPLKIVKVELPYLLTQAPDGQIRVTDFRDVHLMKLSQEYWDIVLHALEGRGDTA